MAKQGLIVRISLKELRAHTIGAHRKSLESLLSALSRTSEAAQFWLLLTVPSTLI